MNNSMHPNKQLAQLSLIKLPLLAVLAVFLTATSAWAQTVIIRSNPVRFTVPVGGTYSNASTVTIVTAGLTADVAFSVAGVPVGASVSLNTNLISINGTHTATLIVETTAALAQGTYDVTIEASGNASYRLPVPLICSYTWSGAVYTNSPATPGNFTTAGNWFGGAAPSSVTDNIIFKDTGGTTNNTGPTTTNIVISASKQVGSVRFAQETSTATIFHNIEFQSGAVLSVTGPDGFSLLRDSKSVARQIDVRMFGNGSLVVNNPAANFGTYIDGQVVATLNLSALDSLNVDVNRLPFGDYRTYPNYYTNGWQGSGSSATTGEINRFVSRVQLAKTNIIKASFVDPNNYNDLGQRDYAMTIGNNNIQASTTDLWLQFGASNAIFIDSVCFAQAIAGSANSRFGFFNSGVNTSNVLFRGIGGMNSRMSVFAIVDPASPAPQANGANRGNVDFLRGTVDALVDRLWISMDRTNNNGQMTVQGSLSFGTGTFDVNDAYLGYQRSGDNLGTASTGFAGPEGTVNVNSNATTAGGLFRVNRTLNLGYTTATTAGGTTSPERCWGRLVITGGTAMISNIVCGGITKFSTNNQITVNGGKLIVTNSIGAADARVAIMTLSGNSPEVTLLGVKAGQTNIFVRRFSAVTSGGVKYIRVPSISGVASYPVTIPLISYVDPSPVFNGLAIIPPSGLYVKTLVDNPTTQTIDVTFTDEPPTVVVWRGYTNNVWDVTTRNWVTQSGGVVTNYSEGFSVVFDNTVGAGPTSIDIAAAVTPGQVAAATGVVVNNQSYTFNSGTILGGSTILKTGSGNLTINASAASAGIIVNSGALLGTGTVGPVQLENGTTMTAFTGTINAGLITSNATVVVAGPVNGGLNLRAGSLINSNTISGNVTMPEGVTLVNLPNGLMNVNVPWTVSTNATLINNGNINHIGTPLGNNGLNVDGTLKGVGRIIQLGGSQASSDVRVTIRAGGNLMIGNSPNEITNMTLAVRVDFNEGSTNTFDVDNTGPVLNDKIILVADGGLNGYGKVNFGIGNNLGGTLLVNRIAGPVFNGATSLQLFDVTSNPPDNANPAVPKAVPAPAPGLVWNTAQVIYNLTLSVTTPPFMTNSISVNTNGTVSYVFDWSQDYRGWRLERLTNSLAVGLEQNSTNWTTLFNLLGSTNQYYYPDTNNLSEYWIRNVITLSTTNDGPVAPASFYRLTYP